MILWQNSLDLLLFITIKIRWKSTPFTTPTKRRAARENVDPRVVSARSVALRVPLGDQSVRFTACGAAYLEALPRGRSRFALAQNRTSFTPFLLDP